MNALAPYKQISAILPDDEALMHGLIHALKEEKGLLTVNHYTCRGVGAIGKRSPGKRFRSPRPKALRMLSVIVEPSRQDEIFEFIFERAEMDKPMGGLLFVGPLDGATAFLMPDGIEDEA